MQVVALTFGSGGPSRGITVERATRVARARAALARRSPGADVVVLAERRDLVVLGTGVPVATAGRTLPLVRTPAPDVGPWADLATTGDACWLSTDAVGLKHVYWYEGAGWAGAATSALVLGSVSDEGLDERAWAAIAFVGNVVGRRSLFERVRRLGPGGSVELRAGRARIQDGDLVEASDVPLHVATSRAVDRALEVAPDAVLELSGGLDSRAILASVPPERRRGRAAVTLGTPDTPDAVVAAELADREDLDHRMIGARPPARTGDELVRTVRHAALARDHASNALVSAITAAAQQAIGDEPRLSGVGGEYARAFYSTGMLTDGPVSHAAVGRLVRGRMITNHRVAGELLADDWEQAALDAVVDDVHEQFAAFDLPMRAASDEFYLYDRVANWAGAAYSAAAERRPVLTPLLHREFVAAASSVPSDQRRDSRAYAAALVELDPGLATVALDSGLRPVDIAAGGFAGFRRTARLGVKAVRKVRQRLTSRRRPETGTSSLASVLGPAFTTDEVVGTLASRGWLADGVLQRATSLPTDGATLSFVVNLHGASTFVDAVRSVDGDAGTARWAA